MLEELQSFFGCGRIRSKGPRSSVLTYAVDSLADLETKILPFFERHRLLVKDSDFATFALLVRAIRRKEHLTDDGFENAVRLAYGMNAVGKQRSRSIEANAVGILRDCTPGTVANDGEDTVRSPWRHGESGRNDLTAHPGKPSRLSSNNNA